MAYRERLHNAEEELIAARRSNIASDIVAARAKFDQAVRDTNRYIAVALEDMAEKIEEAGRAFSSGVVDNFKSNLVSLTKGDQGLSESIDNVMEYITDSIIENFIEGLVTSVTKSGGLVDSFLTNIGSGVYEVGGSIISGIGGFFNRRKGEEETEPVEETSEGAQTASILTSFISTISTMLGIGTTAGAVADGIEVGLLTAILTTNLNILFAMNAHLVAIETLLGALITVSSVSLASGGYVSGPGTSTSDSIPARLSNGEFVVNAAATRQNFGLLSAINNGYATGGLVTRPSTTEVMPVMQSRQEINVNITGDISRQTKREVYGMLPQIAEGVNGHNREKGYKR